MKEKGNQSLLNSIALNYLYSELNFKDMPKVINLVGKKYSRLTVLSFVGRRGKKKDRVYRCVCDCGGMIDVTSYSLSCGKTGSCGCLRRESIKSIFTTHQEGYQIKEYRAWQAMKKRCYTKSIRSHIDYGGRGIVVCDRWLNSYENFLEDMGRAPSAEHSLDRRDNNGNYEPGNCRWATRIEQANNKRNNTMIEFNGKVKSLPDWCRELNLRYSTIKARVSDYGWSFDEAIAGKRNRGQ